MKVETLADVVKALPSAEEEPWNDSTPHKCNGRKSRKEFPVITVLIGERHYLLCLDCDSPVRLTNEEYDY